MKVDKLDIKLLMKLMDVLGPSGNEHEVRLEIMKAIKNYVDEMKVDKFGNLICRKKGNGQKVMLLAHMDEVGLMVNEIKGNGRIKFDAIGGVEPLTLIGQATDIVTRKGVVKGVISSKEIHNSHEVKELPYLDDLYVDTGLHKGELEELGVEIGNYVVPVHHTRFLGSKNFISGKALDDRVGCFVLIEIARNLKKSVHDVYFTFTVQEEIGLYGAQTSVYHIDPDWAVAVETTSSPDSEPSPLVRLDWGPVITIKDAELIASKTLNDFYVSLAKKNKIPFQLEVSEQGTTDVAKIMLSKGGIPSTVISAPVRNLHSTISIASIADIKDMINLLMLGLKNKLKNDYI
jgi:tetrahedral aminopeptidase